MNSSEQSIARESPRNRGRRKQASSRNSHGAMPLRIVDVILCLAIFGVPFLLGGRAAVGELALAMTAVGAAVCWAACLISNPKLGWVRSWSHLLLASIGALLLLQITPLPSSLLHMLSPRIQTLFPLRHADTGFFSEWSCLSLTVDATRRNIISVMACILLFCVASQRMRRLEDVERVLRWVCLCSIAMCIFGLIQYLSANGLYYWFYKLPGGTTIDRVKGAFPNKNHFAQFACLSVGPMIWWCMTVGRTSGNHAQTWGTGKRLPNEVRYGLVIGALAVVISSVLLARSRGAVVAGVAGASVMFAIFYRRSLISKKLIVAICGTGALTGLILLIVGYESIVHRLDNWSDSGRFLIWKANLGIIQEFPFFGSGLGSHVHVHHMYLDQPYATGEYTHAENSYLQVASETGLVGLSLAVSCILACCFWCLRGLCLSQSRGTAILLAAIMCSLIVSCVQALFDFVWYIQGCMVPLVFLMACACRLYQITQENAAVEKRNWIRHVPRPVAVAFGCLLLVAGSWTLGRLIPPVQAEADWRLYRYLALDAAAPEEWRRISGDVGAEVDETTPAFRTRLLAIHRAAKADPQDSRFQLRLGIYYHTLFHLIQQASENPMTIRELQDAGLDGGFESRQQLDEWLGRAVGPHLHYAYAARQHFMRAVDLNPMQAHAYLYLADLGFLRDMDETSSDSEWAGTVASFKAFSHQCVEQALLLRPFNGQMLFAAGRDEMARGEFEAALEYWKRSFHSDISTQTQITRILAQYVSEGLAEFLFESLSPNIEAMQRISEVLAEYGLRRDEEWILQRLSDRLMTRARTSGSRKQVDDWLSAAGVFRRLDQTQNVTECLDSAMDIAPSNFLVRLEYSVWLQELGRADESLEHLQWCRRLQPKNEKVRRLLDRAQQTAYSQNRVWRDSDSSIDQASFESGQKTVEQ